MWNTQSLKFGVKIEEEKNTILLLESLPPSYDHQVTTLLNGKENPAFEQVTGSFLSYETQRKAFNDQVDGLVVRSELKRERDKSNGKNDIGKQSQLKSQQTQDEES